MVLTMYNVNLYLIMNFGASGVKSWNLVYGHTMKLVLTLSPSLRLTTGPTAVKGVQQADAITDICKYLPLVELHR